MLDSVLKELVSPEKEFVTAPARENIELKTNMNGPKTKIRISVMPKILTNLISLLISIKLIEKSENEARVAISNIKTKTPKKVGSPMFVKLTIAMISIKTKINPNNPQELNWSIFDSVCLPIFANPVKATNINIITKIHRTLLIVVNVVFSELRELL